MRAWRRRFAQILTGMVVVVGTGAAVADEEVAPDDLLRDPARRAGKVLIVDDRILSWTFHNGRGFDQFRTKRTPITFELPVAKAPAKRPGEPVARVKGKLKERGESWVFEVESLQLLPADEDRLAQEVAKMAPEDSASRSHWAHWAEARADAYGDEPLRVQGRVLEAEAIRIEADRPGADRLALAYRAKDRHAPSPLPEALANAGLRPLLKPPNPRDEFAASETLKKIESFFPEASQAANAGEIGSTWRTAYDRDPYEAYRSAPEPTRRGFDRVLWADAFVRWLDAKLKKVEDAATVLDLAEQARTRLPERPEVASSLLDRGLDAVTRDIGALKQGEIDRIAALYRERLNQPERAQALVRRWLDDRRSDRWLRDSDAEGRIALALQYQDLLGDRTTAGDLLRAAARIDPENKGVTDAFRRLGFRKVGDAWVEPDHASTAPSDPAPAIRSAPASLDALENKTRAQVQTLLGGKPDRIVRTATQGQIVEQWIYRKPSGGAQYINFVQRPGMSQAIVTGHYTLP